MKFIFEFSILNIYKKFCKTLDSLCVFHKLLKVIVNFFRNQILAAWFLPKFKRASEQQKTEAKI